MALQYLLAPTFQFINTAGKPLSAGAYMEVYLSGTRTKYFCASDFDGTLHPFRIQLDSLGSGIVLANDTDSYDVYAYDRYGSLVMSRYNVKPGAGGGIGGTITSADGSIDIHRTEDGVDLSVNGLDPSCLKASASQRTADGKFHFATLVQEGDQAYVDNGGAIRLAKGWYHFTANVQLAWTSGARNETHQVTLYTTLSSSVIDFDISYVHTETIELSGDVSIVDDGSELVIGVSGLPSGLIARVVGMDVHAITGKDGHDKYYAGDGISIDNDNYISADFDEVQKKLVAGDNITIDPQTNEISASAQQQDISGKLDVDGANATIAGVSTALNKLEAGSQDFLDTDYIIGSDHIASGTSPTTFVRRTFVMLYNRIQAKLEGIFAPISHSQTEGNPHGTTIEDINGLRSELTEIESNIEAVEELIPSETTSSNQLADKAFVNSSITSNTATFRGTSAAGLTEAQFLTWANALTKSNNDYVFWNTVDASGNVVFKRYKYNGTNWIYEFSLNNSSFTAVQWAAINSGITESDVNDIVYNTSARHTHSNKNLLDTYTQSNTNLADAVSKKHSHSNKSVLDNTTASFTTAYETKLDGIESGAQVNPTVDSELSSTSTNPVQNKAVKAALDGYVDGLANWAASDLGATKYVPMSDSSSGLTKKASLNAVRSYINDGMATATDLNAVALVTHDEITLGLATKQDKLPLVPGTTDYDIAVDTARRSGYSWYTSSGNFYGCYLAETNFPNSSSTEQLTFEAFVTIDNSSDSSGYTAGNLTMLVKVRGRGPDDVGLEIKVLSRNGFFVNNRVQPKLVVCRKTSATDYNFYIAVQFVDINSLEAVNIANRNYIYVHPLSKFDSCSINLDRAYGVIPYVAYEAQPIDFSGVAYVLKDGTNSGSPASWAKAHFNGLPKYTTRFVYNQAGSEKLLIFAKGGDGYGTIVRIGYDSTAVQILRVENGTWKSSDWEGIDAHTIDGHLISVGTYSSVPGAISFV